VIAGERQKNLIQECLPHADACAQDVMPLFFVTPQSLILRLIGHRWGKWRKCNYTGLVATDKQPLELRIFFAQFFRIYSD